MTGQVDVDVAFDPTVVEVALRVDEVAAVFMVADVNAVVKLEVTIELADAGVVAASSETTVPTDDKRITPTTHGNEKENMVIAPAGESESLANKQRKSV